MEYLKTCMRNGWNVSNVSPPLLSIFSLSETSKNNIIELLRGVCVCVCVRVCVCVCVWSCYLTWWRGVCPGCIASDSCAAGSNTVVTHHLPCTQTLSHTRTCTHINTLWFKQTGTSTTCLVLGYLLLSLMVYLSHTQTHKCEPLRKQCQCYSFVFLLHSPVPPLSLATALSLYCVLVCVYVCVWSLSRKECVLISLYASVTAAPKH